MNLLRIDWVPGRPDHGWLGLIVKDTSMLSIESIRAFFPEKGYYSSVDTKKLANDLTRKRARYLPGVSIPSLPNHPGVDQSVEIQKADHV